MKRGIGFLLGIVILISWAGAGLAQDQAVSMKWGHHFKSDFFIGVATQKIADLVKERTGGKLKIDVYPSAQLGGYFQMLASAVQGNLDIAWTDGGSVARFYPAGSVTDGAYLFKSMQHLQNFWSSPLGERMQKEIFEKANLKCFPMFTYGTRQLTANKAIRTPQEMKGMRIRSIDARTSLTNIKALGGTPVPVDYSELYMALQQGIVDGQENPITSIFSMKFYEVQKNMMLSNHNHQCIFPVMHRKVWEKLPAPYQKVISDAIMEVVPMSDKMLAELIDSNLKSMVSAGLKVVEVDIEAFRSHALAIVLKEFEKDWYPKIFEEIQKISDK